MWNYFHGKKTKVEDLKKALLSGVKSLPPIPVSKVIQPMVRPGASIGGGFIRLLRGLLWSAKTASELAGASPDAIISQIREKHPKTGKLVKSFIYSSLYNLAKKLLTFLFTMKFLDTEMKGTWKRYLVRYQDILRDLGVSVVEKSEVSSQP